ncbi:hypothetical protein [Chelativorans sp. Marseille-P2723]|uniref:hypothetical protein n=1 Tax=Chelativorans sp. Marseille-P2723 TaxID=2709133 RepID=UPI00156DA6C1|nr:hypothetical protein [Chelativorans sp. Marseille-P2723]
MQKRFLELKQQLAELSETINKFESEAVQLRIVELLFDQARDETLPHQLAEPEGAAYDAGPKQAETPRRGRRAASSEAKLQPRARDGGVPSASGAVAALSSLIESDFFDEKRTIGDIVAKCREEFGVNYKSNAFSGPLSRYSKKNILKREKNPEGNYVYFK